MVFLLLRDVAMDDISLHRFPAGSEDAPFRSRYIYNYSHPVWHSLGFSGFQHTGFMCFYIT